MNVIEHTGMLIVTFKDYVPFMIFDLNEISKRKTKNLAKAKRVYTVGENWRVTCQLMFQRANKV